MCRRLLAVRTGFKHVEVGALQKLRSALPCCLVEDLLVGFFKLGTLNILRVGVKTSHNTIQFMDTLIMHNQLITFQILIVGPWQRTS